MFYEVATRTCQNPSLSSKSVSTMSSDSESSLTLLKVSIGSSDCGVIIPYQDEPLADFGEEEGSRC